MRLVKFTDTDGCDVFINPECVETVAPINGQIEGTEIYLASGRVIVVPDAVNLAVFRIVCGTTYRKDGDR